MLRVALTGGIATGKSYVRARLDSLGVPTIDADVLAHAAVAPGTPGLETVVARFGRAVIGDDGQLDRARLAAVVFADAAARRDLEAIVHPRVQAAIDEWFEAPPASRFGFAVADIPLVFETGRAGAFDVILVTACPPEVQIERVRQRGVSEDDARRRLAAQWPIAEKVRLADYVIRTDGTHEETDTQVASVIEALRRRAAREPHHGSSPPGTS